MSKIQFRSSVNHGYFPQPIKYLKSLTQIEIKKIVSMKSKFPEIFIYLFIHFKVAFFPLTYLNSLFHFY